MNAPPYQYGRAYACGATSSNQRTIWHFPNYSVSIKGAPVTKLNGPMASDGHLADYLVACPSEQLAPACPARTYVFAPPEIKTLFEEMVADELKLQK